MKLTGALPVLTHLLSRWFSRPAATTGSRRNEPRAEPAIRSGPRRGRGAPTFVATVVVVAIEATLGVLDYFLASVPIPVPSSGQLRRARRRLPALVRPARRVRRPLLAGVGTVDLLVEQLLSRPAAPVEHPACPRLEPDESVGERTGPERGGPGLVVPAQITHHRTISDAAQESGIGQVPANPPRVVRVRHLVSTAGAHRSVSRPRVRRLTGAVHRRASRIEHPFA